LEWHCAVTAFPEKMTAVRRSSGGYPLSSSASLKGLARKDRFSYSCFSDAKVEL